jgi:hypothetical protein
MKIPAIQGSPHKGNTFERVERFGSIVKSLGGEGSDHTQLKEESHENR